MPFLNDAGIRSLRTRLARALLVGCATSLASCGGGPQTFEVPPPDDNVPITLVERAAPERLTAVEPEVIAHIRGDTLAAPLSSVRAVAVADDHVYALEQILNEILVFDMDGTLVNRFGGAGDGPGELRRPSHMTRAGDTLFVIDMHGINRFLLDGTYIDRATIDTRAAGGTQNRRPYPQSLEYGAGTLVTSFSWRAGPTPPSPFSDTTSVHRLGTDGVVSEPIAYVITAMIYQMRPGSYGPPLFMGSRQFAVAADGSILVTHQDGVDIDVLAPDGTPVRRIRFDVERREVDDADIEGLVATVERSAASITSVVEDFDVREYVAMIRNHHRARYISAVGEIVPGAGGLLLVRRPDLSPTDVMAEPQTWDLIRDDGAALARLILPARFRPAVLETDRLTGVLLDADDVPSLVTYRLPLR